MKTFSISMFCVLAFVSQLVGANWPAWRGPTGNGLADNEKFPSSFTNEKNIKWKVALPGSGSSTPAIWDDNIFITSSIDSKDGVTCLDRDGKTKWSHAFGNERGGKHKNGSGSNPSPVTDGKNVFVYYKTGTLASVDFQGKEIWQRNLQKDFVADSLWWDLGTSPVLVGNLIVIAVMQEYEGGDPKTEEDSYLVALSKSNGKLKWKTNRTYKVKAETGQSYTTPLVVGEKGKETIITFGSDHLTGHRASDGKLLWDCGGYNPTNKAMWRVIASPSISDGIVVVPYGRKGHFAAVKATGSGDITKTNRLWVHDVGADVPSPIATNGKAYLITDRGEVFCFDLKSGDLAWQQKLPRASASYYSSPVIAGDRMILSREDGVVMVMRLLDSGFELLSKNNMGERLIASPVPLDGALYLRGSKHLFCIGE
ncbi:MAG: PQQ-binding-like beta-propeller repeat protein [Verrucomicrobiales bacterium]|nr:PQQ-binding-like beta-propeller repeat protein [Verrucomicrobiales bacterium]